MEEGFGHWLAGFIDGEGGFTISVRERPSGHAHRQCIFVIGLRADDLAILEEIQRRTGIGQVRVAHDRQPHPVAFWRVGSRADCRTLSDLLYRFPLRGKKQRDLEVWRRALDAWVAGDSLAMRRCKQQLSAVRAFPQKIAA